MKKVKITNNVPYLFNTDKQYKRIYKYFLILNNKGYNFKRKSDLKSFLYKKIGDKTYKNKNEVDEQRVSCVVTNRVTINEVIKVHVYDLFNITSFWDNY